MNISHTQLEDCRKNPRSWVQALAGPRPFFKMGYNQALLHAIHRYHRSSSDASTARKYLQKLVDKHFQNEARSEDIQEKLEAYIKWHKGSGLIVADSKFRIKLNLSVLLELRGEMHRFDMLPNGYRAMLLGDYSPNWEHQLRMPLLQRAAALRFGRPVSDVSVGVQHLDGSHIKVKLYPKAEIAEAEADFKKLSRSIQGYAANIPGLIK
jgi:hypothetical protein